MAKKKNNKVLNLVFSLVPVLLGVIAIFLCFAPGLTNTVVIEIFGNKSTTIYNAQLFGLVFGNGQITSGDKISTLNGGMSIFGLISFVLLVVAIATQVVATFVKLKKTDLIRLVSAACFVVAGILMFFLKTAGTDVILVSGGSDLGGFIGEQKAAFVDVFEDYTLGAGAIVYAILSLLAGASVIVPKFLKK